MATFMRNALMTTWVSNGFLIRGSNGLQGVYRRIRLYICIHIAIDYIICRYIYMYMHTYGRIHLHISMPTYR